MSLHRLIKNISILILSLAISIIHFGSVAFATETINPSLYAGKEYKIVDIAKMFNTEIPLSLQLALF